MELKTCRNCKRLYNHFIGQNLCPACVAELDAIFRKVKEYIYDHPEATMQQVADEFEIAIRVIQGWVREERLEFSNSSAVGLPCEICGTLIKSGRYCVGCKKNMVEQLSSAYKTKQPQETDSSRQNSNKMRFL
ncbi:MAG: flagellar protein [bacterium]|nr:flagellar protein [bacterium]